MAIRVVLALKMVISKMAIPLYCKLNSPSVMYKEVSNEDAYNSFHPLPRLKRTMQPFLLDSGEMELIAKKKNSTRESLTLMFQTPGARV